MPNQAWQKRDECELQQAHPLAVRAEEEHLRLEKARFEEHEGEKSIGMYDLTQREPYILIGLGCLLTTRRHDALVELLDNCAVSEIFLCKPRFCHG